MPQVLIVYGTTEGQTRKIAERMAERARGNGWEAVLHDATTLPLKQDIDWLDMDRADAVIVAGSLHIGRHQTAVKHFIQDNLGALQEKRTAFVSVSLAAAGDEEDRADAQGCVDKLLAATHWCPAAVHLAAGAFRYTQYDFFKRWMMRRIAKDKGVPTDTSRDWELTDWDDLNRFVDGFLGRVRLRCDP